MKPVPNQSKLMHNSSFEQMPLTNQLGSIQINPPKGASILQGSGANASKASQPITSS